MTIKERLTTRFLHAKELAGPHWRKRLVDFDPQFNTFEGAKVLTSVAMVDRKPGVVSADKLERVVMALEKMVGMESKPVV